MNKAFWGLLGTLLGLWFAPQASAQVVQNYWQCVAPSGSNPQGAWCPVNNSNPMPVTASTTVVAFAPTGAASLNAGVTTSNVALGSVGPTAIVSNASTSVDAFVAFGNGSVTTTLTTGIRVPAGSSIAFNVGSNTNMAAITASSTAQLYIGTGTGLPALAGGGTGGGGGGGAVTVADGADSAEGAKADAACGTPTGTCSVIALLKFLNTQAAASIPAGSNLIGGVNISQLGGTAIAPDACQLNARTSTSINISTATTTRLVAPAAAKKTYICGLFLFSAGTQNVGIVEGTGGTCGTSTAGVIGGTTAATGPNLTAQTGFVLPNTGYAQAATAGTNVDFCLITSAAVQVSGVLQWVQQ